MKQLISILILGAAIVSAAQTLSLPEAAAYARTHRASVQAARLRLDQAKLMRRSLGTQPSTTLRLGYSSDTRIGGDEDLVLSQPIDIFGRTSALRGTGDALVLQAEAELRQTELELQNEVISLYLENVRASARLAIAKDAEHASVQLLEAVKGLVEGGKLPGIQATRVSIELDRARAARAMREAEAASAQKRLRAALDDEGASAEDGFPAIDIPELKESELIASRADLLLLSADISSAEAEARSVRTNRLPALELQGRRSPWQDRNGAYGARIQLSFPIFDSGRSRSEENAAGKRAEAARRSLADARKIAFAEIEAGKLEVNGAAEQVKALELVVGTAKDLVSRTQNGLREGANTLIDVLDAYRTLREIEEGLIDARASLAEAQARYIREAGILLEVQP